MYHICDYDVIFIRPRLNQQTDSLDHTVRHLVIASAVVSTLAGTAGISGVADGTAIAAYFNGPYGVAMDGPGTFVIVVRQLVMMGAGDSCRGHCAHPPSPPPPYTCALDCAQFTAHHVTRLSCTCFLVHPFAVPVFLQDQLNHMLRRISLGTAEVTTVAGTAGVPGSTDGIGTAALFNKPSGIAMDAAGATLLVVSCPGPAAHPAGASDPLATLDRFCLSFVGRLVQQRDSPGRSSDRRCDHCRWACWQYRCFGRRRVERAVPIPTQRRHGCRRRACIRRE